MGKATSLAGRLRALKRYAKSRDYDLALAHGSHELTITARRLGIPSATTHDYEYATLQHHLGDRAATKVVVPEAIPVERMARFGVRPQAPSTRGSRRSTTSTTSSRIRALLAELLINRERTLVVVRTPPDVSLYHRRSNPFFPKLLAHLGNEKSVQAVVLPRSSEQRDYVRGLSLPSLIVPDQAVDAQSLIALSDLVVSAGGTMNREAAALGVPVYTTYGGRIGGVDEMLIREGRLRPLTDPRASSSRSEAATGTRGCAAIPLRSWPSC